jgi:hypothetical protein
MCCSHLSDAAAEEAVAAELGIRHAPAGLLAAGSPIGIPRFVREHGQQCAEEARSLVDTLDQFDLSPQEHWPWPLDQLSSGPLRDPRGSGSGTCGRASMMQLAGCGHQRSGLCTTVGVQRAYSCHEAAQRYAAFLASCDAAAVPGKRMLARLQSCSFFGMLGAVTMAAGDEQINPALSPQCSERPAQICARANT